MVIYVPYFLQHLADPTPTNTTMPTTDKESSSLYKQGYAKGVTDYKSVQVTTPPIGTMMWPDDVDCDSNIDPLVNNQDYCSGYQHGYADTFNNALPMKWVIQLKQSTFFTPLHDHYIWQSILYYFQQKYLFLKLLLDNYVSDMVRVNVRRELQGTGNLKRAHRRNRETNGIDR